MLSLTQITQEWLKNSLCILKYYIFLFSKIWIYFDNYESIFIIESSWIILLLWAIKNVQSIYVMFKIHSTNLLKLEIFDNFFAIKFLNIVQ